MIDKKPFQEMIAYLQKEDEIRERIINQSRVVVKESKNVIYALHRGKGSDVDAAVKKIEKEFAALQKVAATTRENNQGASSVAEQEYVEAMLYYDFMTGKKLRTAKELGISVEHYLLGVCDLTGELSRKATMATIAKDFKTVLKVKETLEDIYGQFLLMNLRNSELRKKSDAIKWNLKSVEDVVYDLTLKGLV